MSLIGKSVFGFAAAYLGIAAASASAQQATFTLPVEAHWGKAVLEPGDYTVNFPGAIDPTPVLRIRGTENANVLLQARFRGDGNGTTGKLRLVNVDGTYVVESISNPTNSDRFLFSVPKSHEGNAKAHPPANIAVEIKAAR